MGFVLLLSRRMRDMSMLVISGVMIGYICSAVTDFIVTFADDADIVNLHNWSRGSFSGMSWDNVSVMAAVLSVAVVFTFLLSKPIGAYQLGENYAKNMGVNIVLLRIAVILLSSILSACVVAYAGPISFVGIAVPHLVKNFLKTTEPLFMIPACFLGGSMFCLGCDLIARTMFAPTEPQYQHGDRCLRRARGAMDHGGAQENMSMDKESRKWKIIIFIAKICASGTMESL